MKDMNNQVSHVPYKTVYQDKTQNQNTSVHVNTLNVRDIILKTHLPDTAGYITNDYVLHW